MTRFYRGWTPLHNLLHDFLEINNEGRHTNNEKTPVADVLPPLHLPDS